MWLFVSVQYLLSSSLVLATMFRKAPPGEHIWFGKYDVFTQQHFAIVNIAVELFAVSRVLCRSTRKLVLSKIKQKQIALFLMKVSNMSTENYKDKCGAKLALYSR